MNNYRSILLFPKFDNVDKIESIREDCDVLYGKIRPHITIVFPFLDEIDDLELIKMVRNLLSNEKKFNVKFSKTSYSNDGYIFLNCIEGSNEIIHLHDKLYNDYFKKYYKDIEYIPHITLGQLDNSNEELLKKINEMNDIFECNIDEVSIEKIGQNDESIILSKIKLN